MKTAVVLFNLGGPDSPGALRPFLFNLFNDRAILNLPRLPRWLLAQVISAHRATRARKIYAKIGGGSPLLANTEAQAAALASALARDGLDGARCFVAMRYWHPMSAATAQAVKAFAPELVVLLPLYPQFSTTTTASSLKAWARAARAVGLEAPTRAVCCYPAAPGFVAALARLIRPAFDEAAEAGRPRILFSAHGLPKRIVARGDPYPWQVERTAAALVAALALPDPDWVVCYQSRVGPLEWTGPATDAELARAGRDGVPVVLVPIAFVSEHSETLVELDIECRALARAHGVPVYSRVPAVGTAPEFIAELAALVRRAAAGTRDLASADGDRLCPPELTGCICQGEPAAVDGLVAAQ